MKGDWMFSVIVGLIFLMLLGIGFGVAEIARDNADRETWGRGYCTALNGSWLTAETCNVDGKVVPIPEEAS